MTNAVTNYGTLLKKATVVLAEVVSIDPPEISMEMVEATNHSSNGYQEFVSGGLRKISDFSATCNFTTAATMSGLMTDCLNGTSATYSITFPQGTIYSFTSFVSSVKPQSMDASKPEALQAEVKFRPTGAITVS